MSNWEITATLKDETFCVTESWQIIVTAFTGQAALPISRGINMVSACKSLCFQFVSGRFSALKSDSTHHFFRNACTTPGSLRCSQFSGCWLILSVYILMSFDFPFVRAFGNFVITLICNNYWPYIYLPSVLKETFDTCNTLLSSELFFVVISPIRRKA